MTVTMTLMAMALANVKSAVTDSVIGNDGGNGKEYSIQLSIMTMAMSMVLIMVIAFYRSGREEQPFKANISMA